MEQNATFKDSRGRSWDLTFSVGLAMELRDKLGLDVDKIVDGSGDFIKKIVDDNYKFIAAIELVTNEQREKAGISRQDFLLSLGGDELDAAFDALLYGISASLGKLKRRALLATIPKISKKLDEATETIEAKIESAIGG